MIRRLIFILLLGLIPMCSLAQSQQEIIDHINKASSQMRSLECDFVQTKHLRMLNDKMVSTGNMYYQQANKLRWEYTSPYTYTFILNDNQVLLKNSTRSDVIDVNQSKIFKDIARMMMNSIVGNYLTDDGSFDVSIDSSSEEWVATLLPLKRDLKQMWSKLVLHFDPDRNSVVRVEMWERTGDRTIIELKNIKLNGSIDQATFNIN